MHGSDQQWQKGVGVALTLILVTKFRWSVARNQTEAKSDARHVVPHCR